MANGVKAAVKNQKLMIVEGKDEENFFSAALAHLGIVDVQVLAIGGKTQLTANLKALVLDPKFPSVVSVGVIRDADYVPVGSQTSAATAAFQSVCGSLTTARLTAPAQHGQFSLGPPRVGVFIMPDGVSDGMLEDLCLTAVAGSPEMQCVKNYFICCTAANAIPNNRPKAEAHAWLASRPEPDKRVGEAAQKGYWPFNAQTFTNLWTFVQTL